MSNFNSEGGAPRAYQPRSVMRDRNVLLHDAKQSLGYMDNDGSDVVARNLGSLLSLMRLQLELLIDIRDLMARNATTTDPTTEIRWERRKDAFRKGESFRGLE